MEKHELQDLIRETVLMAVQSTKQENSGLVGDIKTHVALLQHQYKDIKSDLFEIKTQTIKTNGSVMSLKLWRSWVVGGLAILSFLVIPLLGYIFMNNSERVEARLDKLEK